MSSSSRAWVAAASVGAVEALKDQGFARWNYALRSLHQHAKNNLRSPSYSSPQANNIISSSSSSAIHEVVAMRSSDRASQCQEESMRKVMYLSNWGPN